MIEVKVETHHIEKATKLAQEQKEVRKRNTDLYHVDPNDPDQRDHDSIERSSADHEKNK